MRKNFDIPELRAKLKEKTGRKYWRSLEEIAETEEFQDFLKHEFPQGADQWLNPVTRRNFIKLMAASLALGGLAACQPASAEKAVPYVEQPPEVVPSKPLFYATAMQLSGVAMALVAQSNMGRPTKIDGNPDHPASLGATDLFGQASVLTLWDPDRSQTLTQAGQVRTWDSFLVVFQTELDRQRLTQGAGLRILTETITSPSMMAQMEAILNEFPQAKWVQYEPINRDHERQGAILAFGEDMNTVYRFDRANVVVSLDSNFMQVGAANVRYARDFADRRRVRDDSTSMNRMYMVETTPSVTGTLADNRLPLSSAQIEGFTRALAAALGVAVEAPSSVEGVPDDWIPALVEDLQRNAGQSLIIPGGSQRPEVHALAHAMNEVLGNVDQTLIYTDPLEVSTDQMAALTELTEEMEGGQVEVLIIIEANPVYNTPVDLHFRDRIRNVPFRIRMGLYDDETSALCEWQIPMTHYLESWYDARAYDGLVSLTQPLINPLYQGVPPQQLLAAILGRSTQTDYDVVRDYWSEQLSSADFEELWRKSLHDGFIEGTALPAKQVSVASLQLDPPVEAGGIEITFRPDPSIWDGRFANNGWLQEVPKPTTKLTWDNALMVSPSLAEELGLEMNPGRNEADMVRLQYRGVSLDLPIWINPGQAERAVSIALGFGRWRAGSVGNGVGFDAYSIQFSNTPWSDYGVEIRPTGEIYRLASTQMHYLMEDRHPARAVTIQQFRDEPELIVELGGHHIEELSQLSLLPGWPYNGYAWGMAVDLNVCNGCNACVVACQAENNIPIVGKDQVLVGREMQWMRVDTYFEGELDNPLPLAQPMMCHHCEQAPCELVCPVNATVHDAEGLNVMVYNRCIGTRYCSNNCPYKVRRFNFLDYVNTTSESLKGHRNPEVTVRTRGVMEKCTYCVQHISAARIQAKIENRPIQDGEVVTACQAACPTKAIYFGDINDPTSEVAQWKAQPQNYEVLALLGNRPRTSYLAKFTNPNPEIANGHGHGEEGE